MQLKYENAVTGRVWRVYQLQNDDGKWMLSLLNREVKTSCYLSHCHCHLAIGYRKYVSFKAEALPN